jgi:hypothetical protein
MMTVMPFEPSRDLAHKKLRDCFPNSGEASDALKILDAYGTEIWHREKNRVHLALLKVSEGSLENLRLHTRGAQTDFRDTLVLAEFPEEGRASSKTPADEMIAIRVRDRNQYEAWLQSAGE